MCFQDCPYREKISPRILFNRNQSYLQIVMITINFCIGQKGGTHLNRMEKLLFSIMFIALFMIITACASSANDEQTKDEVTIYTTIYPIQFITEQLTGEFADVRTLYPPGVDAHTYEATTKDMIDMSSSSAFIYLGAGMESFAEQTAEALESSDVQLIEVGEHEQLFIESDGEHDDHDHHHHGDHDPHIWFDPLRMINVADLLKEELIALFPEETQTIEENYTSLTDDFIELDEQFTELFGTKTNKTMVVSHAAYGYWEERYGIEQIAISGISATEEPSQKELAQLIERATEEQVQYIFFEQNTSNQIASIVQEHLDAEPLYIHNLEVLMEEDIERGDDYFTIMQVNIDVLDRGIQ